MYEYLINSNTSVVPIHSQNLSTGEFSRVYLTSTTNIGQVITIRDMEGYLSTPQAIQISTVAGTRITGGISTLRIQQGYGYITLRAIGTNEWCPIDENAFRDPANVYSIRGITYGAINVVKTAFIKTYVSSTGSIAGIELQTSSFQTIGPFFISSLSVNNYPRIQNGFADSNIYFQTGSLNISQSTVINSSITVSKSVVIQGNATVNGTISTTGSLNTIGDVQFTTATGVLKVVGFVSTNTRLLVDNAISTGKHAQLLNTGRVVGSLNTSTIVTNAHYGSIDVTNDIVLSQSTFIRNRPDLQVVSPTYTSTVTPVLEIQQGIFQNSAVSSVLRSIDVNLNYMRTNVLAVSNSISAPTLTNLFVPRALIRNPNGVLYVSSVATTSLQTLTPFNSVLFVTAGNVQTSSIFFQTIFNAQNSTNVETTTTDICSTNTAFTSTINFGSVQLSVNALGLSSFFVSSAFLANQMSSFSAPISMINNTQGRLYTSNANTSTLMTSSIFGTHYITNNSPMFLSTTQVQAQNISISSGNAFQVSTGLITGSAIMLGVPLEYSSIGANDPYLTTSTVSGISTNTQYEYINGLGTNYNPLLIHASMDRTVNIYLQNTSTFSTRYLTIQYSYRNDGSATGLAGIRLINKGLQSTILSFNASPIQAYQQGVLSNFPVDPNTIQSTLQYYLTGPTTYQQASVSTSRNVLVAGGTAPTNSLAYSSDGGSNWTPLPFTQLTTCSGLAWGSNKWIAVGEGTNTSVLLSYTGASWYPLSNVFSVRGKGVAWNGSLWVSVGEGTNSIAYSKDGVNWTGLGTSIFTIGTGVAWNGSLWIATGSGTNTLAYSLNGSNWNGQQSFVFSQAGYAVATNGSNFIATGKGVNTLAISSDGVSWAVQNVFQTAGTAIAWNGSQWLAGSSNDTVAQVASSSDGSTWTKTSLTGILSNVMAITYSANQWVVTGTGQKTIAYSSNALNWTGTTGSNVFTTGLALASRQIAPTSLQTQDPTCIACGSSSTALLAITTDGSTWSTVSTPFTQKVNCVAWNGYLWLAGGQGTYPIAYSSNGLSWTGITLTNMTAVYGIAWGLNKWIAVGQGAGYTRAESTDGINWTEISSSTGSFFSTAGYGIQWAGYIWVSTGSPDGILFSLDGSSWVTQTTSLFSTGRCLATNGSIWLAGGESASYPLAYSYDGVTWNGIPNSNSFFTSVLAIAWGSNTWIAVGLGANSIAYSFDGVHWTGLGTTIFTTGTGITWNGSKWFATGTGANTLAYSLDGLTWIGLGTALFSTGTYLGNPGTGTSVVSKMILPNTVNNINEPVQIRWDLSGVLLLSPTSLEKAANSEINWTARASSLDGLTDTAYLTFVPRQLVAGYMIGFSEAPRSTNSFTALNYAFYLTDTRTVELYELGVRVADLGAFVITDIFELQFTGTQIIYWKNSVRQRTVPRLTGNPLYLSSSFRIPGTRVDGIEFRPIYQITALKPLQTSNSYLTSIRPALDNLEYISYSMPYQSSNIPVGQWAFQVPLSGTLSTTSSLLYADFCLNGTKLFSTNVIQSPFLPQLSTYTLSFGVSEAVSTTVGDTVSLRFRTLRGTGVTNFYTNYSTPTTSLSTVIKNDIYNLSSISYLQVYHTSFGSGLQTSEVSLSLNELSTNSQTYVNSNYGIQMNTGYMKWNNQLYGLSIQNRYNDYQGRSITYSGALYNASDPRLKYDIGYANISSLYTTIDSLPLHSYTFTDEFKKTYRPVDAHQLGVLTTEVSQLLPSIVNEVEPAHLELSSLQTIDKQQLRYAHLGATQYLIARISTLKQALADHLG